MCMGNPFSKLPPGAIKKPTNGVITEEEIKCEYCKHRVTIRIIKKGIEKYIVKYRCKNCGTEKECRFANISNAYDELIKIYWESKKRFDC